MRNIITGGITARLQMKKKAIWASALLMLGGGGAHSDHHLPPAEVFTPGSSELNDLLFSDIAYRAAYCSAVIEAHRPSAGGGHLPDPKAMIKWKYMLSQLDGASKAPPADSVRMQEARNLAEADMVEMTSMERKQSAIFSGYTRMDSAACNDALSWLP